MAMENCPAYAAAIMVVVFFLAGCIALAMIMAQVKRIRAFRRLRKGSRIAQTSRGQVEYLVAGSGPAILVLHGGVGGWDQGLGIGTSLLAPMGKHARFVTDVAEADGLVRGRCVLICPSRVGYLRTPLASGRSPAEGADAMAALLDKLDVHRVIVVGVSGGGPTALQFAIRHQNKTVALLMVAAISKRHVQPRQTTDSVVGRIVFARGVGWIVDLVLASFLAFAGVFPRWTTSKLLEATETLDGAGLRKRLDHIVRHQESLAWLLDLIRSIYPLSARSEGLRNDLEQFACIEDYALREVKCPTLVVHGRVDGNVPLEHAKHVVLGVPGAEIVVDENCGHFLWTSENEARTRAEIEAFLLRYASGASLFDQPSG